MQTMYTTSNSDLPYSPDAESPIAQSLDFLLNSPPAGERDLLSLRDLDGLAEAHGDLQNAPDAYVVQPLTEDGFAGSNDQSLQPIDAIAPLYTVETPRSLPIPEITPQSDSVAIAINGEYAPTGQAIAGQNAAFDLIGLTQLRNDSRFSGIDGSGYTVAVIDTGLDYTHPLLKGNYVTGYNFVDNTSEPTDYLRHGTHVSGIIGATDPKVGIATDVGLIGLQVFGTRSLSYNPAIEKALQWVYANREKYNIAAVNMSIGGGNYTSKAQVVGDLISDDIQTLEKVGIPVVTAAGNGYQANQTQNLASPAIQSTIAVGSVWQDNKYASYWWGAGATDYSTGADRITATSQRMDVPNMFFAPGALINSTVPGAKLEEFGGTSMAAPMVSGTIALMQEAATQYAGRRLSITEILNILRSSADSIFDGDDEDNSVASTKTTYKRINVYNAIQTIYQQFNGSNNNSGVETAPIKDDSNPALDPNGTLKTATVGPSLNGEPVRVTYGEIGKDGTSTIGSKDVDLIKFSVLTAGNVTLELLPDYINRRDFDSLLRVFNQQGNEIGFDDNTGIDNFSKANLFLNPGTYYAGISGSGNRNYNPQKAGSGSNGTTGTYALRLSLSPSSGGNATSLTTTEEAIAITDPIVGTDLGDTLVGSKNADTLSGRGGNDVLKGSGGNDTLNGDLGDDVLKGSGGNDTLDGGNGNDRLLGSRGNDILRGGSGRNLLVGDAGRDRFVLAPSGRQTVRDFEAGTDQLQLEGGLSMGSLSFRTRSDRTLVKAFGETIAVFLNVTPADLGA